MRDILLVIVAIKEKVTARKWKSTMCGKEVIVKDKLYKLKTFALRDLPQKTEHIEDLENFLAQELKDPGAMKTNKFEKTYTCATAVQGKAKLESKNGKKTKQVEKLKRPECQD